MISRRRLLSSIASSAVLAGCAATDVLRGQGIDEATPIFDCPFRFADENGVPTTFSRWRGSPIVTTGFYGSCTLRCPMTIDKLRGIDEALRAHGQSAEFVLVTIDPDNDTRERLRRWKESRRLPPSWHLLRGSKGDTIGFARWLQLNVARDSGHIDHDVKIAVLDPAGRLVARYAGWNFGNDELVAALH